MLASANERSPLSGTEVARAVVGLAGLYGLRLLGMYLVLPVLSLYTATLDGATPLLIGMSLGVYGLSQAALQIPFGAWSDRYGRRRVIISGLLLFALGSVIAAQATSAWLLVVGRMFQGAGAIASAIVAMMADLTGPEARARAMGAIGVSVGIAFAAGMIFGPSVSSRLGVPALFWFTAGLSTAGALYVALFIPKVTKERHHEDVEYTGGQAGVVLHHPALLRLDAGIFALHALITSLFVVGPGLLSRYVPVQEHGNIYAPIVLLAVPLLGVSAFYADRNGRLRETILLGSLCLIAAQITLLFGVRGLPWVVVAIGCTVAGIATAEPAMPAMLTRITAPHLRGTAAGIFHTCQFMGSFAGGVLGGAMLRHPDIVAPVLIGIAVLWSLISLGLPDMRKESSSPAQTYRPGSSRSEDDASEHGASEDGASDEDAVRRRVGRA